MWSYVPGKHKEGTAGKATIAVCIHYILLFYYSPPPKKVGKYNRMFDGNIGCSDTCYYVRPAQSDSDAILILPAKKRIKPLPILSDLGSF